MGTIGWMVTYDGKSGGRWVRDQVIQGAPDRHSIHRVVNEIGLDRTLPASLFRVATHDDPDVDLWIENPTSVTVRAPSRRDRRIAVLQGGFQNRDGSIEDLLKKVEARAYFRRVDEMEEIVVVSDFLRDHLRERGVTTDIEVVYNGLPVEQFDLDEEAVETRRHGLSDDPETPLIHVGMCQPTKGGKKVYEHLQHMNAEFVTTGRMSQDVPITHLHPDYEEYLRLLAACDVFIAMSEWPEGWCLQVQEAMLCRTPVVGSGSGGMGMLLEGGEQLVCEDYDELESLVRFAIANQDDLGEKGYAYGRQFTRERMVDGWIDVFDRLL